MFVVCLSVGWTATYSQAAGIMFYSLN